jgi:flagellin FlaB
MFNFKGLHRDESGQTALEAAIILIAFIVVASVFAFAILSSGSKSTEKGQPAINAGLQGVQSSMEVKGAVIANGNGTSVDSLLVTRSLVAGGDSIDMNETDRKVVISYRDSQQVVNKLDWTIDETNGWLVSNDGATPDTLLENGELVEITIPLTGATLGPNTEFTIEIKPPTGAVINLTRTTSPAIEPVMDLL